MLVDHAVNHSDLERASFLKMTKWTRGGMTSEQPTDAHTMMHTKFTSYVMVWGLCHANLHLSTRPLGQYHHIHWCAGHGGDALNRYTVKLYSLSQCDPRVTC